MPDPFNAGAPPSPTPALCARCGAAIELGLARCPTCGAPRPRPGAAAGPVRRIVGALTGLVGLALVAGWIYPPLFRHLRLGPVARWLEASPGHRLLAMFAIWIPYVLGHGAARVRARAASGRALAPADGGPGPATMAAAGWSGDLEVRTRTQTWLLTLDTVGDRSSPQARMRCMVTPRREFHFALLPQRALARAITSPRLGGALLALGRSAGAGGPAGEPARLAFQEMSFIVGEPIQLGEPEFDRAFLLKSDNEAAARSLCAALRGDFLGLRRPDGAWQMTVAVSLSRRFGELEYLEAGNVHDADRLEAVRQVMTRVLESLAAAGIIGGTRPASNP